MESENLSQINDLITLKDFEKAKELLHEFLVLDKNNVEALKLLGLCNINLGHFSEGRRNFETVVKYKNDDATSWFYLANCYDNLNDFLHAKTAYLEVIKLRENYMDAYRNLGVIYLKSKEPDKAFDIAKKALEFVKDDYLFYYLAGTALLAAKDFQQCIQYLEKSIEFNPKHPQVYNNLGTAYLSTGNYDKAFEAYLKASNLNPREPMTFYNIGSILQIQRKHKAACEFFQKAYNLEKSEHFLVSLALSEFKAELFKEAASHYKLLVSQHPEKHNFQYNLVCCYEMMGEYTFAIGILDQLVLLNPKSKMMLQKLAQLYLKVQNPAKAKDIYEKIINQGIVSEEIYYEYAMVCVQTNNTDTAETILKKVVELNPNASHAHKDLGVIYLNKRLFDYAKDEFEKAYSISPENSGIIFEYANFLHATSDFAKAQEFYEKVLTKEPENPNILVFAALNSMMLNKFEDALKYITAAVEIIPDDYFILFNAGKIAYAMKDYEKALMFLVRAWEKNPAPDVENLLGLNYFELGEFEKANKIFLKLLKENDKNTILLFNSAKCYKELFDITKAKSQLKKALKIFPEFEEAKELLKIIN